jgi:hypothetical protein
MITKFIENGDESLENQMRQMRNAFLASSDWTQLADNGLSDSDREAWATYRQQLRDFPATWTPAPTADFPDPPA